MNGLMQPGPTLYEAEKLRERSGSQGLLRSIGEPMSYAPNPLVASLGGGLLSLQYLTGEKNLNEGLSELAMMSGLLQGTKVAPIARGVSAVQDMFKGTKLEEQMKGTKELPIGTKVELTKWGHTYSGTVIGNKYINSGQKGGEGFFAPIVTLDRSLRVDQRPYGNLDINDILTDYKGRHLGKTINANPFSIEAVYSGPKKAIDIPR